MISGATLALASSQALAQQAEPAHDHAHSAMIENQDQSGEKTAADLEENWGDWGVNTENMNPAVKPGNDFFAYANSHWIDNTELAADQVRYGSFNLLRDKSELLVRDII